MAGFRPRQAQDIAGLGAYALGAALAAFSPIAAIALYFLVAPAYVVPGLIAEAARRRRARRSD